MSEWMDLFFEEKPYFINNSEESKENEI